MAGIKSTRKIHNQRFYDTVKTRVKRLREYGAPVSVADGYDLTKIRQWSEARFAAVTRMEESAFNYLDSMPASGYQVIKTRNKKLSRKIHETFSSEANKPKWFNKTLLPLPYKPVKISLDKNDNLIIEKKDDKKNKVLRVVIKTNAENMAIDPQEEIKRVYQYGKEQYDATGYILKAGSKYFGSGSYNGGFFVHINQGLELVAALDEKYGNLHEWLGAVEIIRVVGKPPASITKTMSVVSQILTDNDRISAKAKKKKKAKAKRIMRAMRKAGYKI